MNRKGIFAAALAVLVSGWMTAGADLYRRAPDVLPGTLPEMRDPDYWIAQMDKPDEVLLTPDEIERMNGAYEEKMRSPDPFAGVHPDRLPKEDEANRLDRWPGRILAPMPWIRTMSPDSIAVIVREKIREDLEFMRKRQFGNFLAVEYAAREIDDFEHEMALDLVPDFVVTRDGIAVRTTRLRVVPSLFPEQMGILDNARYRWDIWTTNLVKIGRPVTILHASRSGSHVFVLSDDGFGWVESQDIAFGHSAEIKSFAGAGRFVVCTGDRVPFYTDKRCMYVSGWLRMGDRVPLEGNDDPSIVRVPARRSNGAFVAETAWLARDADVSLDWLPYTRRNIVVIAFKLLDNPYDWTMAFYGRNHETTYRDIFACFGFRLPFHGSLFTHFGGDDRVAEPDMDTQAKYDMILAHEPFVTLHASRSNVGILLGSYNGVPISFNTNGYGYTDENGVGYEIRRACIVDTRMPPYFLENPVTFLELK